MISSYFNPKMVHICDDRRVERLTPHIGGDAQWTADFKECGSPWNMRIELAGITLDRGSAFYSGSAIGVRLKAGVAVGSSTT